MFSLIPVSFSSSHHILTGQEINEQLYILKVLFKEITALNSFVNQVHIYTGKHKFCYVFITYYECSFEQDVEFLIMY